MSIAGVSCCSQLATIQSNFQQLRQQFTQLGQDLSAGSLSQAQTDFVTLSQAASAQFGSNSAISQTLNAVGQALQSGKLSAAQQAYSSLPVNTTAPNAVSGHSHAHGHHRPSLQQDLGQLGQALQAGNLSAAQQAFAAIQQGWQQLAGATGSPSSAGSTAQSASNPLSVTA